MNSYKKNALDKLYIFVKRNVIVGDMFVKSFIF